jgi:hypothetical protein
LLTAVTDEAIAKAQALALRVLADRLSMAKASRSLSVSHSPPHEPVVMKAKASAALLRIGWNIKRESSFTKFFHVLTGQMLSSPFTIKMR